MGIETIDGQQMQHRDTPMDGGWGYDSEPHTATAVRFPSWRPAGEAAANVAIVDRVVSSAMAETAMSQGVSYAGEVPAVPDSPEPGFRPFPTLP